MTDLISMPMFRRWAAGMGGEEEVLMLALVEAVEAAMAVQASRASYAETQVSSPEERRLLIALARFDFQVRE